MAAPVVGQPMAMAGYPVPMAGMAGVPMAGMAGVPMAGMAGVAAAPVAGVAAAPVPAGFVTQSPF